MNPLAAIFGENALTQSHLPSDAVAQGDYHVIPGDVPGIVAFMNELFSPISGHDRHFGGFKEDGTRTTFASNPALAPQIAAPPESSDADLINLPTRDEANIPISVDDVLPIPELFSPEELQAQKDLALLPTGDIPASKTPVRRKDSTADPKRKPTKIILASPPTRGGGTTKQDINRVNASRPNVPTNDVPLTDGELFGSIDPAGIPSTDNRSGLVTAVDTAGETLDEGTDAVLEGLGTINEILNRFFFSKDEAARRNEAAGQSIRDAQGASSGRIGSKVGEIASGVNQRNFDKGISALEESFGPLVRQLLQTLIQRIQRIRGSDSEIPTVNSPTVNSPAERPSSDLGEVNPNAIRLDPEFEAAGEGDVGGVTGGPEDMVRALLLRMQSLKEPEAPGASANRNLQSALVKRTLAR